MAKKDKDKGSNKAAGVKLPKALRKGAIGKLFTSQLGREILADALLAAAAAAAAALVKKRPSAKQVAGAGEAVADAGAKAADMTRDAVQDAAAVVANVVADAARQIFPGKASGAERESSEADNKGYDHLAGRATKRKKDKHSGRTSKH